MGTMSTLAAIRARLAAAEVKNSQTSDGTVFAFWNMKNGGQSTLRFLPDGDPSNTFFWVEKQQIHLKFNGIKNGEQKEVKVYVPCVEMFGKELYPHGCPILSEVRSWYKVAEKTGDDALKTQANSYWKKPTFIMQGFVRENGLTEDNTPENPIRRFTLNKQLYNLVKSGLMDVEMVNIPSDYDHGTDFKILSTMKGTYADYGTSKYARNESALTSVERAAIEQYGLTNLSEFMGKKPDAKELEIIKEMFEASVDGEAYDRERWGNYYRPIGLRSEEKTETTSDSGDATKKQIAEFETKPKQEKIEVTTETNPIDAPAQKATTKEIMDIIRARGKKTE